MLPKNLSLLLHQYLPYFLLVVVLLLHIFTYTQHLPQYRLDETIVTVISRQPFPTLLKTIEAEPHPPGFYLLLHMLPTQDIFLTRVIISALSLLLLGIAVWYAYTHKIVERYSLIPGLSIIFASYGFLELTATVKQESISFPLLLLSFFVSLRYFSLPVSKRYPSFVALNCLALMIMSFGYIYGFLSLIPIAAVFLFSKTNTKFILTSAAVVCVGVVYTTLLGFAQLINNSTRFSWTETNYNSLFQTLSIFLTGQSFLGMFSDLSVLLLLVCIGILVAFFPKLETTQKKRLGIFALLISSLVIMCYFLNLFIRPRYVFPILSLICIYAGWGILQLKKYYSIIVTVIAIFFLLNSATYFVTAATPTVSQKLSQHIQTRQYSGQIGLLDEHAMYPYIFKINNATYENVIPLNIFNPNITTDFTNLTKEQLLTEGKFQDMSTEEYAQLLEQSEMNQFFYKMQTQERPAYYDPQRKILATLTEYCQLESVFSLSYTDTLFEFRNCAFNQ